MEMQPIINLKFHKYIATSIALVQMQWVKKLHNASSLNPSSQTPTPNFKNHRTETKRNSKFPSFKPENELTQRQSNTLARLTEVTTFIPHSDQVPQTEPNSQIHQSNTGIAATLPPRPKKTPRLTPPNSPQETKPSTNPNTPANDSGTRQRQEWDAMQCDRRECNW